LVRSADRDVAAVGRPREGIRIDASDRDALGEEVSFPVDDHDAPRRLRDGALVCIRWPTQEGEPHTVKRPAGHGVDLVARGDPPTLALPRIDGEDIAVLRIRNEPVGSEAERWRQPRLTTGVDQPGKEKTEQGDQDSRHSPSAWRDRSEV